MKRARVSAVLSTRHVIVRNDGPRAATEVIAVDANAPGESPIRELDRRPTLAAGERWLVELPVHREEDTKILVYWRDPGGAQQLVLTRTPER